MEDSSRSIKSIPENILLDILSYLPVKDRCIAGRVCKQWRRIVRDNSLWRHVNLLDYCLDLTKMWKVLRTHFSPCLQTFRIRGFAHSHTDRKKRKKFSVSDPMLKELSNRSPNLYLLHLHDCNTDNLTFESFPATLTSLAITHSTWQPRWLRDQQLHLPKLESLDLSGSVRVDNFDLEDIAMWTNLKHLSLRGCYRIKGSNLEVIAKNVTELITLDVSETSIDNLAIHHIARHLKKLKHFCMSHCCVGDEGLSLIATGLPKLETVDVSHCNITVKGMESLTCLPLLKTIVCEGNEISDEEKDTLRKLLPKNILKL